MYIMDGIAYAGEPARPIGVVCARPLDGYRLHVRFNTGEEGEFDFSPLLDQPCFKPLKDTDLFRQVYVEYGALTWADGEIDIAPEYVHEHAAMTQRQGA